MPRATRVRIADAPEELPDTPDAIHVEHFAAKWSFRTSRSAIRANDTLTPVPRNLTADRAGSDGRSVGERFRKSTILNLLPAVYDPGRRNSMEGISRITARACAAFRARATGEFLQRFDPRQHPLRPLEATMDQVIAARRPCMVHQQAAEWLRHESGGAAGCPPGAEAADQHRLAFCESDDPLLDEPTSSIEPESEAARLDAGSPDENRTTVLTSHRPSLITRRIGFT